MTPTLTQNDAGGTIDFCTKVFGAKVRSTMPGPGGKLMHAEIMIGDSMVMLNDAVMAPAREGSLFLYVSDVDKTIEKAVQAGAAIVAPAENTFWGDRFGQVKDSQGNLWSIATRVEDVPPREVKKRQQAFAQQMAAGGP